MNLTDHLERGAREHPDRPALRFAGQTTSYADLAAAVRAFAAHLAAEGVRPGDRVALALPNRPELVVAYLGAIRLGAIAVTLSAQWQSPELHHGLTDSGATVLVADADRLARIDPETRVGIRHVCAVEEFRAHLQATGGPGAAVQVEPDTPAAIVYSSGTTGTAKGCVLSHANVVTNAEAKVEFLDLVGDDRLLLFVPLSHCFGQNAILNAGLEAGATVVLEDGFAPGRIEQLAARERPTRFFGPPTAFLALLDAVDPAALDCFTYYFSAAAPLSVATALRFEDTFGRPVHQGYGLTETSPFATYNHREEIRLGSVGTAITDVQLCVTDPDTGTELPVDEIGEVLVRGPNVMLGYWNRPDETAAKLRDGWLRTGDLGRLDADGYLSLVDRLDDMINVAGQKVFPAEVEAVLAAQPGVAAAAAYPVADPVFGQRVAATVVPATGHPPRTEDLVAACRRQLAAYKVPQSIELADTLPVSPTGKLLRRALRR